MACPPSSGHAPTASIEIASAVGAPLLLMWWPWSFSFLSLALTCSVFVLWKERRPQLKWCGSVVVVVKFAAVEDIRVQLQH